MKAELYPISFEPGYEEFQERISELLQEKSVKKEGIDLENLQHELELIKEEIEDQGLGFSGSSIFSRYATTQELAQKKKNASDCCFGCGEETKKPIQCELCAELFCKSCCMRKRTIPHQEHREFRLCCEECHQAYMKYFNHQDFYKQTAIFLKAISDLQRKYQKASSKFEEKEKQVKAYREEKRAFKMKESALKKSLLEEDKKAKQLKEDYEKVIQQNAQRLKAEQDRAREQERKKQEEQRLKQEQTQRESQAAEQNQKDLGGSPNESVAESSDKKREELNEREKKQQEKQNGSEQQEKGLQQTKMIHSEAKDERTEAKKQTEQPQMPTEQQSSSMDERVNVLSIAQTSSQKQNQEIEPQVKATKEAGVDQQQLPDPIPIKEIQSQIVENTAKQSEVENAVDRADNENSASVPAPAQQRITMSDIKTMDMNQLLSMKIPMNPSLPSSHRKSQNRKSEEFRLKRAHDSQSDLSDNERVQEEYSQSLIEPKHTPVDELKTTRESKEFRESEASESDRKSIKQFNAHQSDSEEPNEGKEEAHQHFEDVREEESEQQRAISKSHILRRQSLITSGNTETPKKANPKRSEHYAPDEGSQEEEGEIKKCTCEIM